MINKSETLLVILIALAIVVGLFALSGLIFWGLGILIVKTFNINYTWTYMHGLCVAFIVSILSSIFSKGK